MCGTRGAVKGWMDLVLGPRSLCPQDSTCTLSLPLYCVCEVCVTGQSVTRAKRECSITSLGRGRY